MAKKTDSYMVRMTLAKSPDEMMSIMGEGIAAVQTDLHKVVTGYNAADIQLVAVALQKELDLVTDGAGANIA